VERTPSPSFSKHFLYRTKNTKKNYPPPPGGRKQFQHHYIIYNISLTSDNFPQPAAAAAIAGLIKCVRPPRPWRPSKLRLEVEAQRSPGASLSAFMARDIEQPGSRHSNPASTKILSRPSSSAC